PHRLDRGPAVAGRGELCGVRARCAHDLVPRDVRLDLRLEGSRVDEEHVDAVLANPVAQGGELAAFRVERAEGDDGLQGARGYRYAPGSTRRYPAPGSVSW